MSSKKTPSFKQLLKDKGFYIALALCVLAVGVVAATSLSYVFPLEQEEEETPSTTTAPTTATTTAQVVQNPVSNVPDLRTTTTMPTTMPTTTAVAPEELYVLPLSNEICAPFSKGELLYSETMGDWRVHNGVDFTGEEGQTVKAAAAGKITVIKEDVLWGHMIEIDHGFGIVTRYCGVAARGKQVGDVVKVGEVIGVLGTIPCEAEEGSHLHLEVLSEGKPLDAVEVIGVEVRYKE